MNKKDISYPYVLSDKQFNEITYNLYKSKNRNKSQNTKHSFYPVLTNIQIALMQRALG